MQHGSAAAKLRVMHESGCFVLPNSWDSTPHLSRLPPCSGRMGRVPPRRSRHQTNGVFNLLANGAAFGDLNELFREEL
jgi:hypothetical protein